MRSVSGHSFKTTNSSQRHSASAAAVAEATCIARATPGGTEAAEAEAARRVVVGWVMGVERKRRRAMAKAKEAEDPSTM